jgi:hypothetical protein
LQGSRQLDIGDKAVAKGDPKAVAAEVSDAQDVVFGCHGRGKL